MEQKQGYSKMTTVCVESGTDEKTIKEYTEFQKKVERTVFLHNLSPVVTTSVVSKALNQFGDVVDVHFIPNLTVPFPIPECALVEMKNAKQAEAVIKVLTNSPFMVSGTPRPVRAQAATPEMFPDRPTPHGRVIRARWVDPSDPDFEVGKEMKRLCKKQTAKTLELTKLALAREVKIEQKQKKMLEAFFKKHEMTEKTKADLHHLYESGR